MLNSILLAVTTICIPVIILVSLYLFRYKNLDKVLKILIIITLSLELLRFFYNASLYKQAKTPSNSLTFSFISFEIVFGLFAIFNKGKVGNFFKRIVTYTCLISMIYALFAPRVYLSGMDSEGNLLDKYAVENALYFVESGLIFTSGIIYLYQNKDENLKYHTLSLLFSILIYGTYIGISIGTKYLWEIEYEYDINFYLATFMPLVSMVMIYLVEIIYLSIKNKKKN